MNFLVAFEQLERERVKPLDDPFDNLIVPPGESVRQGGIWAVELFPPSHYEELERGLRRNGWEGEFRLMVDGTNVDQVRRAREGRGFAWSRIGTVVGSNSRSFVPDAKREKLPDEFERVDLIATQIGTSLTAIVAHFSLSKTGESSLNAVWNSRHEPRMRLRGLRHPQVLSRHFAAIEATQTERKRIHDLGRRWLAQRCGGFFARTECGQPVVDLNLFDKFDPLTHPVDRSIRDPLRALGMDVVGPHTYVSEQVPGLVLVPSRSRPTRTEPIDNCWAFNGEYKSVEERNDRPGYGPRPLEPSALGAMLDHAIRAFLLHFSVLRYIEELRANYSLARDQARTRHGRFTARRMRQLRDELLTTSLDLPSVARDTEVLWNDSWRQWNGIDVKAQVNPEEAEAHDAELDLTEHLDKVRVASFEDLIAEDDAYRTVLSTAASLGSSADLARTGRLALFVALVSLGVAVMSLLAGDRGLESLRGIFGL
jgi:hypothetical protein